MRKVQTVIVAPNIEQIESEGGLDDLLASILAQAEQSRTPVVFALSRKKLGQVPSSCALACCCWHAPAPPVVKILVVKLLCMANAEPGVAE